MPSVVSAKKLRRSLCPQMPSLVALVTVIDRLISRNRLRVLLLPSVDYYPVVSYNNHASKPSSILDKRLPELKSTRNGEGRCTIRTTIRCFSRLNNTATQQELGAMLANRPRFIHILLPPLLPPSYSWLGRTFGSAVFTACRARCAPIDQKTHPQLPLSRPSPPYLRHSAHRSDRKHKVHLGIL